MINKIFSIKEYNTTHNLLTLMGLKIKFPKREYAKKQKENPYFYYIKNNVDITTIPPADGQTRDIQLANLALLVEFDFVCKSAGLQYWLDAGTLIGAIRHKGFVPWDDDIDVGMIREDYEKIAEAFQKYSRNPDIYVDYCNDRNFNYMLKVQHKGCKHLFVDIFPFDHYGKKLSIDEQVEKTKEIKSTRERLKQVFSEQSSCESISQSYYNEMQKIINRPCVENSDIVWGIDYGHRWRNWFTRYETIYPLKTISFEGLEFSCMNTPEDFLTRLYGDYMAYPKKIGFGHSAYLDLSIDDKTVIKTLIQGLNLNND